MKLRNFAVSFFTFFFACSILAQSDASEILTLEEVKSIAIKNSLETKNARLEIKSAKKKIWETTAIGLPQVEGKLSYQHTPGDLPSMKMPDFNDPSKIMEIEMGQKNSTTYDITASQLVFSGEYIVGLRASKAYKSLSERQLVKASIDVDEGVTKTFYTILALEQNKNNIEQSQKNLENTYKEIEASVKVGVIDETELDQISLKLNNLKTSVKNLNRNIEISYNLLKTQMGVDSENEFKIDGDLDKLIESVDIKETGMANFDPEVNSDMKLVGIQEKLAKLDLNREQSLYLPQIAAFYKYTDYVKEPEVNFQPKSLVGLNLTIPIFTSGSRYAKVKQKKYELEKTRNTKYNLQQKLNLLFNQNRSKLTTAYETYINNKQNEEIAEKLYNNARKQSNAGMITSLALTQFHDQYLMAQMDKTNSMVELLNAKLEYDKLFK